MPEQSGVPIYCDTSCYQLADVNNTDLNMYLVFTMSNTTLLTPINKSLGSL